MENKKAFITGITGQDGSYLAEFLLNKGYEVHGLVRRVALEDPEHRFRRINHIKDKLKLHVGTLESYSRILEIFDKVKPDECYHLAAQSFVHESFEDSFSTFNINIFGTLHVLSAIKSKCPNCKIYFAGTSEMFGKAEETPQSEKTRFHPRSPYGVSKVAGFDIVRNFREAYGLFACTGILFNHESPRRGYEFVTRKITRSIAKIKNGAENVLLLGNIEAKRDWGFSRDYVEAMWMMLQQKNPKDYVIGTGETHSVKEFLDMAFLEAQLSYEIVDMHNLSIEEADKEILKLKEKKENVYVVKYPRFYRPAEVDLLLADPSLAKKELGWESKTSFEELVRMMVNADLKEKSFGNSY